MTVSEVSTAPAIQSAGQDSGYHQCWYPVALSSQLGVGQAVGIDLCDGRVVVYRTQNGDVHAMVPYCKHMGADLSIGDVVDDELRCPFHHWQYGADGRCTKIPSGDRIPRQARLRTFPVEDKWGLIWVFWGSEPLYPVPSFEGYDDETMISHAFEAALAESIKVDPWVFASNVFDIVHNRVVHGLQIADPEVQVIDSYTARMHWDSEYIERESGKMRTDIDVYGTNVIRTRGEHDGRLTWHIAGVTPLGRGNTRVFFVLATLRDQGAREHLERQQTLHNRFVNEDLPILNSMRLGDFHLVGNDRAMARYFKFARDYPRKTMAELEILD